MNNKTSKRIRRLTLEAIFTAILCIIAPWSVPLGSVPVSLATFGVYLIGLTLGRHGVVAIACYILLGCLGLPVFSGFACGIGVFLGPTGGFLAGYIPAVLICGFLRDIISHKMKSKVCRTVGNIITVVLSAALIHACGILWYMKLTGVPFGEAMLVCVLPFIIPECLKIISSVLVSQVITERILSGNAFFCEK